MVSTGCSWCRVQDLRSACAGPLVVCPLLLSALSLCPRCVACKYGSVPRFKGVLAGFGGLYWLRALRALLAYLACEKLGGLEA